jgi:hypothetical protein
MIRLLAHPLPPFHSSKFLSLFFLVCRRSSLLTGDGGGGEEEPNLRERPILYKSSNTLLGWGAVRKLILCQRYIKNSHLG